MPCTMLAWLVSANWSGVIGGGACGAGAGAACFTWSPALCGWTLLSASANCRSVLAGLVVCVLSAGLSATGAAVVAWIDESSESSEADCALGVPFWVAALFAACG